MTGKCKMTGNETMLPCSAAVCPLFDDCLVKYEKAVKKPETNADRIRRTDDVELMNRIYELHILLSELGHYEIAEQFCDCKAECQDGEDCSEDRVKACILRWLQQPAGESTNDRCATCLRWSERNGVDEERCPLINEEGSKS